MSTPKTVEQLYSLTAVAKLLSVHVNTVRRAVHSGKIQAYVLSRTVVRVPASALARYLEARAL